MSDRAMSEAAMLSSLHDIRLPETAPGGIAADMFAAVCLAALAALFVAAALRLFSLRTERAPRDRLRNELEQLHSQPQDARRVALLHLLRDRAPDRYAEISKTLYRPDGIDIDALEAEVGRLV